MTMDRKRFRTDFAVQADGNDKTFFLNSVLG